MQAASAQAKVLNKAAYFFSVTEEQKVVHVNFLPKADISKTFTAKTWIQEVSVIVGGKVSLRTGSSFPCLLTSFPIRVEARMTRRREWEPKSLGWTRRSRSLRRFGAQGHDERFKMLSRLQ